MANQLKPGANDRGSFFIGPTAIHWQAEVPGVQSLLQRAFKDDLLASEGGFSASLESNGADSGENGLAIEIVDRRSRPSYEQVESGNLLPFEKTAIHLKRERDIRGWVLGDLLHLEDGEHFLDLDYKEGRATISLSPSFTATPRLLTHTYFLLAVIELLRTRGFYYLHGSCAVSPRGQGVLFLGPGGSGKSTAAFLLWRCGWRLVGDDALLVRIVEGRTLQERRVAVYPLLHRLLLDGTAVHRFPGLLFDSLEENGKGRVRLHKPSHPSFLPERKVIPTAAFVLKRGGGAGAFTEPIRRSRVMAELIRENPFLFMQTELAARHLEALTYLSKQCRTAELRCDAGFLENPHLLEAEVEHLAATREPTWSATL